MSDADKPRPGMILWHDLTVKNAEAVRDALAKLTADAAEPDVNLMPAIIDAVKAYATEEEISDAMASVFGTYVETAII